MSGKRFWRFFNRSDDEVELRIEGEIVDDDDTWAYEWLGIQHVTPNAFREELAKYKGKDLTVWIDSLGGVVWAAAGIYNALMEHQGRVTVKIDGKVLSAATIIAMAGDEVLMSPAAVMMVHNPWVHVAGDADSLRHMAGVLDEIKEAIINAYEIKTGLTRDELERLMDEETWMSARKAVELGFADGLLYTGDKCAQATARAAPVYAFSRLDVQMKADAAMRRLFDVARSLRGDDERERLALELELIKLKEVDGDEYVDP
ncbi:MAG TPA: Clp protease ClpP [Bacillota bacterium]|mgnify:CR=1 FL=1|nr:Clp protease ClpP [Bacillota bacterium]